MSRSMLFAALLLPAVASAQTRMITASGMPLADGALAPGMLTVRVVEGEFNANIPDIEIALDIAGRAAPQVARTGSDGCAQFAHLPVGAKVRASLMVQGRRFESATFRVPRESGVRLLLVAGEGRATATRPVVSPTVARAALPSPASLPPVKPSAQRDLLIVQTVVIGLTVLAAVVVVFQGRRA